MSFSLLSRKKQPEKVVVFSDAVYHSYLGEYFFGQTEVITFGSGYNAWGGLINPTDSNVDMYLNAYTITNFANQPITAEGWLSSSLPGKVKTSRDFAAGNRSIVPPPLPLVKIQSVSLTPKKPAGGTYTFTRRVEPAQTLTKHDFQGMYIIPPGSSFVLFFLNSGKDLVQARIACGWWEEKRL